MPDHSKLLAPNPKIIQALSAAVEYDDGMFLSVAAGAAKGKQ